VDIEIDPQCAYFPFLRLGLARYQPHALAGLELSSIVATEFIQLLPHRTACVTVDECSDEVRTVRLAVQGASPLSGRPGGRVPYTKLYARVDEERHASMGDLDSVDGYRKALDRKASWVPLRDCKREFQEATYDEANLTWDLTLEINAKCNTRYSLYIEERECIQIDQAEKPNEDPESLDSQRVVYCDRLLLNVSARGI
jgi:hypothetical protein